MATSNRTGRGTSRNKRCRDTVCVVWNSLNIQQTWLTCWVTATSVNVERETKDTNQSDELWYVRRAADCLTTDDFPFHAASTTTGDDMNGLLFLITPPRTLIDINLNIWSGNTSRVRLVRAVTYSTRCISAQLQTLLFKNETDVKLMLIDNWTWNNCAKT